MLREIDPVLADQQNGPLVQRYYESHGPCDRPPCLAFLCVRVGLASLPALLPDFPPDLVAPQKEAATQQEGEGERQASELLQAKEEAAARYWLEIARRIDASLELAGCGPHQWTPSLSAKANHRCPVVPEQPANSKGTEKATGQRSLFPDSYGINHEDAGTSGGVP